MLRVFSSTLLVAFIIALITPCLCDLPISTPAIVAPFSSTMYSGSDAFPTTHYSTVGYSMDHPLEGVIGAGSELYTVDTVAQKTTTVLVLSVFVNLHIGIVNLHIHHSLYAEQDNLTLETPALVFGVPAIEGAPARVAVVQNATLKIDSVSQADPRMWWADIPTDGMTGATRHLCCGACPAYLDAATAAAATSVSCGALTTDNNGAQGGGADTAFVKTYVQQNRTSATFLVAEDVNSSTSTNATASVTFFTSGRYLVRVTAANGAQAPVLTINRALIPSSSLFDAHDCSGAVVGDQRIVLCLPNTSAKLPALVYTEATDYQETDLLDNTILTPALPAGFSVPSVMGRRLPVIMRPTTAAERQAVGADSALAMPVYTDARGRIVVQTLVVNTLTLGLTLGLTASVYEAGGQTYAEPMVAFNRPMSVHPLGATGDALTGATVASGLAGMWEGTESMVYEVRAKEACGRNTYYNQATGTCQACNAATYSYTEDFNYFASCRQCSYLNATAPDGTTYYRAGTFRGDTCEPCPAGHVCNGQTATVPCSGALVPNYNSTVCVATCPTGYKYSEMAPTYKQECGAVCTETGQYWTLAPGAGGLASYGTCQRCTPTNAVSGRANYLYIGDQTDVPVDCRACPAGSICTSYAVRTCAPGTEPNTAATSCVVSAAADVNNGIGLSLEALIWACGGTIFGLLVVAFALRLWATASVAKYTLRARIAAAEIAKSRATRGSRASRAGSVAGNNVADLAELNGMLPAPGPRRGTSRVGSRAGSRAGSMAGSRISSVFQGPTLRKKSTVALEDLPDIMDVLEMEAPVLRRRVSIVEEEEECSFSD